MTKLAAAIRPGCWPRATKYARQRGKSEGSRELEAPSFSARQPGSIPRGVLANLLEFRDAAFHYSVIGRQAAARRAADKTFNSVRTASSPGRAVPLQMHKERLDGPSIRTRQFRFRTGDRKINGNGFESDGCDNGQSHVYAGLLMRLVKNIHATLPSYATTAPILHAQHVMQAQCGITLNTGAADATGR